MKILAATLLFLSVDAFALNTVTCIDSTKTKSIVIEFDINNRSVETIESQRQTTTGIQSTMIYQRSPMIRGGRAVAYCNPDEHVYRNDSFGLLSVCKLANTSGHMVFEAQFNIKNGGKISFEGTPGSHIEWNFSDCR